MRLHLVLRLHLEVLHPLEAPLKEARAPVHPAGKCQTILDPFFSGWGGGEVGEGEFLKHIT